MERVSERHSAVARGSRGENENRDGEMAWTPSVTERDDETETTIVSNQSLFNSICPTYTIVIINRLKIIWTISRIHYLFLTDCYQNIHCCQIKKKMKNILVFLFDSKKIVFIFIIFLQVKFMTMSLSLKSTVKIEWNYLVTSIFSIFFRTRVTHCPRVHLEFW